MLSFHPVYDKLGCVSWMQGLSKQVMLDHGHVITLWPSDIQFFSSFFFKAEGNYRWFSISRV